MDEPDRSYWVALAIVLIVVVLFSVACDYFGVEAKPPYGPENPLFWDK